jgi:hypothetical protein
MMASGKSAKKQRRALPVITQREGLPWLTISAVAVIVALAAVIFVVVFNARQDKNAAAAAVAAFVPSASNPDPSTTIKDIYVGTTDQYKVGLHIEEPTRVAYDRYPPVGGPHDAVWAACNGVVYTVAVRNENMVHTLEHGAIWITYNPDTIAAGDLDLLKARVEGKQYITLSPYPALSTKISLQSWGHQLMLDSAGDERINQFITALQRNTNTTPEVNGTCDQPTFDTASPPAFDASTPGPDAVQMDGTGGTSGAVATQDTAELQTGSTADTGAATEGTDTVTATPTATGDVAPTDTTDTAATDTAPVSATTG